MSQHFESPLPAGKHWKLVWHDEFDGDTLDMSKWSFRHHLFHKEYPAYTEEGVEVSGGCLHIKVVKKDGQFCSAQLQTVKTTWTGLGKVHGLSHLFLPQNFFINTAIMNVAVVFRGRRAGGLLSGSSHR